MYSFNILQLINILFCFNKLTLVNINLRGSLVFHTHKVMFYNIIMKNLNLLYFLLLSKYEISSSVMQPFSEVNYCAFNFF